MIPDIKENDLVHSMWEEFVTLQQISKPYLVRPEILDSWKRSRALNVDPFKKTNLVALTPKELRIRQEVNANLISVAEPIMKKIYEFIKVKDSVFVVTLHDSEGYVLKVVGDPQEYGSFSSLYEGCSCSESWIGTNAPGTTLATGKPTQIQGAEHYCLYAHSAACSSTPIYDTEGSIIAVLNITGRKEEGVVQRHTLGMIIASADTITNQLRCEKKVYQQQFILESLPVGIVVLNRDGFITHINSIASDILKLEHDYVVGKKLDIFLTRKTKVNKNLIEALASDANVTDELYALDIAGGIIQCQVTLRPMVSKSGFRKGIVITLVKTKRVRQSQRLLGSTAQASFVDIIGQESLFIASLRMARKVAASDVTVVITGESGTGKEILTQAIHNASGRADHPFIAVNCGAIPRDLLESELFGYEDGAFTGARKGGNIGKFELADGGTLFLDEIGEMPLGMQVALLRVLEEHAIERIGGKKLIPVNVRIIAATSKNLADEIADGNFRTDLFYRLNVINIEMPPLRKRKGDIPLLARELARGITGTKVTFEADAMSTLTNYTYPGNIRELKNIIEYALAIGEGNRISLDVLPEYVKRATGKRMRDWEDENRVNWIVPLKGVEISVIKNSISECNGNISLAAKQLGINRSTVYRKLAEAREQIAIEK